MLDFSELARRWNAIYNGAVIADDHLGYLVMSVERILIAWCAVLLLRSLARYISAALPEPHTVDNVAYWLRWWLWLRLREFPLLKLGAAGVAVLLLLQIPAGAGGALSDATLYLLLIYPTWIAALVGMTQLLNHLTYKITHPES